MLRMLIKTDWGFIAMFNRKELKQEARNALQEKKIQPYMVTLVFLLIGLILEILSTKLNYPGVSFREFMEAYFNEDELLKLMNASSNRGFLSRALGIAITLMNVMLSSGFTLYCLNVSRRDSASVGNLFDTFGNFGKIFFMHVLRDLIIALLSILFVIPGIIATYRYSFAMYIMLDHPEMSPIECLRKSKELTNGYKMELFKLDLSFLGWVILSVIPFVNLYTIPYMSVTHANCYRMIIGSDVQNQENDSEDQYTQQW